MKQFLKLIDDCQHCELSKLELNQRNYLKGYGKLLPFYVDHFKNKTLLVGLNPSYRRWKRVSRAFGGNVEHPGTGWRFYKLLNSNNLLDKVVITNLIKCSCLDNKPPAFSYEACYTNIFISEIELLQPKKIISLGSNVYEFLRDKMNVDKIYHPVYWISYHKISSENYLKLLQSKIE